MHSNGPFTSNIKEPKAIISFQPACSTFQTTSITHRFNALIPAKSSSWCASPLVHEIVSELNFFYLQTTTVHKHN